MTPANDNPVQHRHFRRDAGLACLAVTTILATYWHPFVMAGVATYALFCGFVWSFCGMAGDE